MKAERVFIGILLGATLACTGAQAESLARQTTQQSAQGPETVKRVQAALAKEGYYPGEINGQFNKQTEDALKQAQKDKFLKPTGQLDQETLFELGVTAWVPEESESPTQEMPADQERSRS
ncbi:MAG TPA: peptidoglycan-binding protein [Burkholderiales bacterium]|jgi:peptidoglycan hydrolase-like protein with peptidoglycan-binding domain|nr:peptidoglycan-binding protein [Burkholderiales bacterium]